MSDTAIWGKIPIKSDIIMMEKDSDTAMIGEALQLILF